MNQNHTTGRTNTLSRSRRGVAMMLAVVALAVGTVLAVAALTSNQNSERIGANAVSHTSSEWSGHAAAELVVAAMQTETDWKSIILNGTLMENWTIADSTVDVTVTNLEGGPVTDADREVLLSIVSETNGVRTVIEKLVSLSGVSTFGEDIDPSLGEFAIYAGTGLDVRSNAVVSVWGKSPEAGLRSEAKIGTAAKSASAISFDANAQFKNAKLYVCQDAPVSIHSYINDALFKGGALLPNIIPFVPAFLTYADVALTKFGTTLDYASEDVVYPYFFEFALLRVRNGSTLTIDGGSTPLVAFGAVSVESGGEIIIQGDVRMVVEGDVTMDNAAFLVEPGASLELLVGDDFQMDNSIFGVDSNVLDETERDATDVDDDVDPTKIHVCSVKHPSASTFLPQWRLQNRSIFVGSMSAPLASFRHQSNSTIIGRVTARTVQLDSNTALLYDPRFDSRMGFTDLRSPIYDAGNLRAEYEPAIYIIKTLSEIDASKIKSEESLLRDLYNEASDKGAFLREITSILLDIDMRRTGDDVGNPFTEVATALFTSGDGYSKVESTIDNLMKHITPSNTTVTGDMLVNDPGFYAVLDNPTKTALGILSLTPAATVDVEVDNPTVDALGPDLGGKYTARRAGKARSRSIEELASVIETQ